MLKKSLRLTLVALALLLALVGPAVQGQYVYADCATSGSGTVCGK